MHRTLIALLLAMLAGCSSSSEQPAATAVSEPSRVATTTTPAAASPTASSPDTSDSGNVTKRVGQWAELQDEAGATLVRFRVTKITVGYKCPNRDAEKSKYGRYIAIWMDIYTTRDVKMTSESVPYFNTVDWRILGADGAEQNDIEGNAALCAREADQLPSQLDGKRHVRGVVVLDSAHAHGTLALVQDYMDNGWEYAF